MLIAARIIDPAKTFFCFWQFLVLSVAELEEYTACAGKYMEKFEDLSPPRIMKTWANNKYV